MKMELAIERSKRGLHCLYRTSVQTEMKKKSQCNPRTVERGPRGLLCANPSRMRIAIRKVRESLQVDGTSLLETRGAKGREKYQGY